MKYVVIHEDRDSAEFVVRTGIKGVASKFHISMIDLLQMNITVCKTRAMVRTSNKYAQICLSITRIVLLELNIGNPKLQIPVNTMEPV